MGNSPGGTGGGGGGGGQGGDGGDNGNPSSGQFGSSEFTSSTPQSTDVNLDPNAYQQLNDKLGSMADKMASITSSVNTLGKILQDALKPLDEMNKKTETLGDSVKDIVNQYDDVKDRLKALLELQKRTSQFQNTNIRNFRDLNKEVKKLQDESKDISRSGFMSADTQRTLQRLMNATKNMVGDINTDMKKLGKSADDALDPDVLKKYNNQMADLNRQTLNAIANFGKLKSVGVYGRAKAGFQDAGVRLEDNPLIGHHLSKVRPFLPGEYTNRFRKFSQAAANIKQAKMHRAAGNSNIYARAKNSFTPERLADLGFNRTPAGKFEWTAGKGGTGGARSYEKIAAELARNAGGGGFLDRKLGGRALSGDPDGVLARLASSGGGSVMKGIGSTIGGVAESGISGAASVVGKAAVPFAILESIRELFDHQTEMNKKVESTLGAGGILNAGGGSFVGTRNALNPINGGFGYGGAYNYQRNLGIAGSVVGAGLDVSELAKGAGKTAAGFAPGSMGRFQQNVYGAGRVTGLGDANVVNTTIKLLQQYRQSFVSTEDFFVKLSKNAQAAGLSTTKYLSIIDDVTSNFDRMNKSFGETMSTLELLGKTGRLSADDLKEYLGAIGGGGQKVDLATSAYLYRTQTQEQRQAVVGARDYQVQAAREQVRKSFGTALPEDELNKAQSPADIARLKSKYIDASGITDKGQLMEMNSTLDGLRTALVKRGGAAQFARTGDVLGAATFQQATGADFIDNMTKTTTALGEIERRMRSAGRLGKDETITGALRKNPNEVLGSVFAQQVGGQFGVSPEDFQKFSNAIQEIPESQAKAIREGTLAGGTGQAAEIYDKVQRELSGKGLGAARNDAEKATQLKQFAGGSKDNLASLSDAITNSLDKSSLQDLLKDMSGHDQQVTQAEKDAQRDKASRAEKETRSTADMFANAFEYLFNKLWEPMVKAAEGIGKIVDFIEHKFGFTSDKGPNKEDLSNLNMLQANGGADKIYDYWASKYKTSQDADDKKGMEEAKKAMMEADNWRNGGSVLSKDQAAYRNQIGSEAQRSNLPYDSVLNGKDDADKAQRLEYQLRKMDPTGHFDQASGSWIVGSDANMKGIQNYLSDSRISGMASVTPGANGSSSTIHLNQTFNNTDASQTLATAGSPNTRSTRDAGETSTKNLSPTSTTGVN